MLLPNFISVSRRIYFSLYISTLNSLLHRDIKLRRMQQRRFVVYFKMMLYKFYFNVVLGVQHHGTVRAQPFSTLVQYNVSSGSAPKPSFA